MNAQRLYYEVLKEYSYNIHKCTIFNDYFFTKKTRLNKYKCLIDYDTFLAFNVSLQRIKEEILYIHLILKSNGKKSPCKLIIDRIEEEEEEYTIL